MSWNYRIVRHLDGHLELHEVHYDKDGKPWGMTEVPAKFVSDKDENPAAIIMALRMAIRDVMRHPILNQQEVMIGGRP